MSFWVIFILIHLQQNWKLSWSTSFLSPSAERLGNEERGLRTFSRVEASEPKEGQRTVLSTFILFYFFLLKMARRSGSLRQEYQKTSFSKILHERLNRRRVFFSSAVSVLNRIKSVWFMSRLKKILAVIHLWSLSSLPITEVVTWRRKNFRSLLSECHAVAGCTRCDCI